MKMKNVFSMKTLSLVVLTGIAFLYSCKKDSENPLNSTDSQNVNSETVSASSSDESSDISNSLMFGLTNTKLNAGSRISGTILGSLFDKRLAGATITITPDGSSTADHPVGTIEINFGDGVTVNGVTRKGIIYINYNGAKWANGSTRVVTYSNFYRNSIKVDGTLTITNTGSDSTGTSFTFTHELAGGTLTFPGGTTVLRSSLFYVTLNFSDLSVSYYGTAEGTTRALKTYATVISNETPLVRKATCLTSGVFIPVSGTKLVTVTGGLVPVVYSINYGTGACDNSVTVTIDGLKTVTVTASSSGN